MIDKKMFGATLATAAAMVFTAIPVTSFAADAATDTAPCYGVNSCKGQSACKTATNSCKGQNSCKGKGYMMETTDQCKTMGGNMNAPKS